MKIIFNKKIVDGPWGGGNQMLLSLVDYLVANNNYVSYKLEKDADVVFIMDVKDQSCSFSIEELKRFKEEKGVKIIHRINDNGSHRKNNEERNDNLMINVNKNLADKTIFISDWLKRYYESKGHFVNKSVVIPNGVDRRIFSCSDDEVRSPKDPIKIITHHWSSNIAKGFDIYNLLGDFCNKNPSVATFTFMGNHPSGFLNNCNKLPPQTYKEVPCVLKKNDVYVTATQYESGGCHIIEGMACGLIPLVKKGGGGTEEYSSGYGYYYSDFNGLVDCILKLYNNYDLFIQNRNNVRNNYKYGSWDMGKKYCDMIL